MGFRSRFGCRAGIWGSLGPGFGAARFRPAASRAAPTKARCWRCGGGPELRPPGRSGAVPTITFVRGPRRRYGSAALMGLLSLMGSAALMGLPALMGSAGLVGLATLMGAACTYRTGHCYGASCYGTALLMGLPVLMGSAMLMGLPALMGSAMLMGLHALIGLPMLIGLATLMGPAVLMGLPALMGPAGRGVAEDPKSLSRCSVPTALLSLMGRWGHTAM